MVTITAAKIARQAQQTPTLIEHIQHVKSKLFTKDDPLHIHKTLGVLCLMNYSWRIFYLPMEADMGFASHPHYTILTIVLHVSLNASSLFFQIPKQRIATDGGRIWPEYRLHSFVFLSRSMLGIFVNYYYQYSDTRNYVWNLVIVLLANGLGDLASW